MHDSPGKYERAEYEKDGFVAEERIRHLIWQDVECGNEYYGKNACYSQRDKVRDPKDEA